jgi:uncharacterized membrane protein
MASGCASGGAIGTAQPPSAVARVVMRRPPATPSQPQRSAPLKLPLERPSGDNEPSMRRFKPLHGIALVAVFIASVVLVELALDRRLGTGGYERVAPARDGLVHINLDQVGPLQVKFFRFLNAGNQEVKFFVGRDARGEIQVAFDASEVCAKTKRGFRQQGEWVVCNKCDKAFRLAEINAGGGGCKPVPLEHRIAAGEILLAETDILRGWRLFR